jgi:Cu(I)/Ag(I) efflux system membrane fusion protein
MNTTLWLQRFARSRIGTALFACAGTLLLVALLSGEGDAPSPQTSHALEQPADGHPLTSGKTHWTCAMHPHIHRDGPGQCPVCGMDLVEAGHDTHRQNTDSISFSPAQKALMRVQTVAAERRYPTAEQRLVGKVALDETSLAEITAWVPGRIERLFVDATGLHVREGDHMVDLYSPELISAQAELLQAIGSLSNAGSGSLRQALQETVEAARAKLRRWGLTEEQVRGIERRGKPDDTVTIYAPASGVVVQRNVQEGMYVQTGTRIFTIADLRRVWVQLDAYESDLGWLRYGQTVRFTTETFPGETFEGQVSFIDPMLNPDTRTVKVRVQVDNAEERLKPEMFVRARVAVRLAGGGKVLQESLAGKWISPMHPEILSDQPGACPICGMELVTTESFGIATAPPQGARPPVIIPATAPLLTGERAIVYVEDPHAEQPTYAGREVVLGARAGDYYIVEQGLSAGELVVVAGNFLIDSALQIQARPSMMNAHGGSTPGTHRH